MAIGVGGGGELDLTGCCKIGEVVTTVPTIGFNVESVTYKNLNFNVWVCLLYPHIPFYHVLRKLTSAAGSWYEMSSFHQ